MTKYTPLWEQSGSYNARADRTIITHLWDEGVMDALAFKVTQRAAGANFTVDIAAGVAVVSGDVDVDQGNYVCRETAATTGTTVTSAPSAGNERYDRVILEVRDNTEDAVAAGGNNDWRFRVVAGTPAAVGTGTIPALPSHSISLATIGPILNSTTTITNSLITDTRTLAGRRCLAGTLELTAGSGLVINGWLSCDGGAVSRATYARLFAAIGTSYGAGNGSTTFNLPDLRGRVPLQAKTGLVNGDTPGQTGGEYTHQITLTEMPAHSHTINHDHSNATASGGAHTHIYATRSNTGAGTTSQSGSGVGDLPGNTGGTGDHSHDVDIPAFSGSSGPAGSGIPMNNMPPYTVVAGYIIRT